MTSKRPTKGPDMKIMKMGDLKRNPSPQGEPQAICVCKFQKPETIKNCPIHGEKKDPKPKVKPAKKKAKKKKVATPAKAGETGENLTPEELEGERLKQLPQYSREELEGFWPMVRGPKSMYTEELADKIFDGLAAGKSLRTICESDEFPTRGTVARWVVHNEDFAERYYRARDIGLDDLADEMIAIADDTSEDADVNRDRLRIDARKWYLSKLASKRYGDKLQLANDGEAPLRLQIDTTLNFVEAENGEWTQRE